MKQTSAASNDDNLNTSTLFFYAVPALPLATLALVLTVIIPNFYTSSVGLSLTAVGATLLALRVFDAVIDPTIGYCVDKTKVAFGRRRLWVLLAMPLTALSAFMIFVPPQGVSIWYLALWMLLLSLGMSTMSLSYAAWGAELTTDYDKRNKVSAFRQVSILLGTLVATITPVALNALFEGDTDFHLLVLASFIAFLLPIGTLMLIFMVPEPENRSHKGLPLKEGLRALFQNKPFIRLIFAFIFNSFANGLPVTLFLFYVTDVLNAKEWRELLLFLYFLIGMAGVPLWVWLSKKLGKHKAWSYGMLTACAVFAFAPLLGPGDVWIFAIITVITGMILGADLIIPASIQADVIDYDTAQTGEQRSGLYFAAWSVATQLSLAGAVGVAFPLLDFAGFDASQSGNLSPDAPGLFMLAVLYGWVPVVMKMIAIGLMWSFPIDRELQQQLNEKIEANRASSLG